MRCCGRPAGRRRREPPQQQGQQQPPPPPPPLLRLLGLRQLSTSSATSLLLGVFIVSTLVSGSQAIFETDIYGPAEPPKPGVRGYIDLAKPVISSLCNFANQDGVGSDHCKACTDSLKLLIDHLMEQRTWAVMMADALVKPPSGLLSGTFSFVSHYDQCMKIPAVDTDEIVDVLDKYPSIPPLVKGAYCGFKLRLKRNPHFVRPLNQTLSEFQETMKKEESKMDDVYKLQPEFPGFLGLCVPSACSKMSFTSMGRAIKNMLYKFIYDNKEKFPVVIGITPVSCQTNETAGKVNWTFSGRLIAAIFVGLTVLVGIGTLVDVIVCLRMDRESLMQKGDEIRHTYDEKIRSPFVQMLRSCSAVVSFRRLMDTRLPHETIRCLNGVRFFALLWLVMGNTGQLRAGNMTTNLKEMQKALETMSTQFVLNKDLAVDSLFVVAGISFAYGLARGSGVLHMLKYVAHEVIVTLPGYYLLLWFLAKCFTGLGQGPTWDIESRRYLDKCDSSWWSNILLINNFVPIEQQCMPHSWLVAMLMQALLVAVIATLCWKKSENLTHFILGVLVVVTMIVDFIINIANNLGPTTLLREYRPGSRNAYMTHVGMQLYTRGAPFLIGLIVGFIFNQRMYRKKTFSGLERVASTAMWLMILAAVFATVNATFGWNKGDSSPSRAMSALYDALHRVVFALATSLLVMMCYAGKGGIFNMILSWPGFIPIARLWLLVYLVNPFVIFHGNGTLRAPQYYTKKLLMAEILWNFVISLAVSMIVHLLLVAPFLAVEEYLYDLVQGDDDDDSEEPYRSRFDVEARNPESARGSSPSSNNRELPEDYARHSHDRGVGSSGAAGGGGAGVDAAAEDSVGPSDNHV